MAYSNLKSLHKTTKDALSSVPEIMTLNPMLSDEALSVVFFIPSFNLGSGRPSLNSYTVLLTNLL